MRILVLSMLRIGDLFMHKPLIQAIQEKHPESTIDLVVNSVSASAATLLNGLVDKTFVFSRDEYQKSAGEAHFNIFWGAEQIDILIDELSSQNYDIIYNLTHNRLSAYLAGAVSAKAYRGLRYVSGQFVGVENAWLNYFNERFPESRASVFHYTELLGSGLGLDVSKNKVRKNAQRSGLIILQCFSSEDRKNWPLTNFFELKQKIEEAYPFHIVRVVATEKERGDLLHFFSDEEIWVTDFSMTESLLKEARLFIGVDTSVKHLAALCGTPVVEVALGGSDPIKTGAFIAGARAVVGELEVAVDEVFSAVVQALSRKEIFEASEATSTLDCDRWVWASYLDGKTPLPRPKVEAGYIARSFKLLEWQLRLEKALTECSDLYLKGKIQAQEVQDFILVAQEVINSKLDKGGYFFKLIDVLQRTSDDGAAVYSQLVEAVAQSRSLLKIRSELALGDKDVAESREALATGA